jgi:undecaprenyl-diphosphatase
MNAKSPSQSPKVFNNETEKQTKIRALVLLIASILIFIVAATGMVDWLSNLTSEFLKDNLGFTNKWSTSYGPQWFLGLNGDVSALGGFPIIFILFSIIIIYYYLRNESGRLWRFAFIILIGAFIMLTFKMIFGEELIDEPLEIFIGSISSFPSGHAMMGTIFYATLAVTISRRQHSQKTKSLTLITGIVIIILIGISRILPGIHTLKEVIAGWSLGLIWIILCWFLDRYIKENRDLKKRSLNN